MRQQDMAGRTPYFGFRASLVAAAGLMGRFAQATCEDSYWPVYAGGATGSEDVRCFALDEKNGLLIVGGVTSSSDFGPAPADHGYLYALDFYGNWIWGNFYYNAQYKLDSIEGCQMSSKGNALAATGMSDGRPVLFTINPEDGSFESFISVDIDQGFEDNLFETNGAIFFDEEDYRDGEPYLYSSFKSRGVVHTLRASLLAEDTTFSDDWTNILRGFGAFDGLSFDQDSELRFITAAPDDESSLYTIGRHNGLGSVTKINKRDGLHDWNIRFGLMTDLNGYAFLDDGRMLVCGERAETIDGSTDVQYTGAIALIDSEGDVGMFSEIHGKSNAQASAGIPRQDRCLGIAYYEPFDRAFVLVQGKMLELRDIDSSTDGSYYDNMLIFFDYENGQNLYYVTYSQGSAGIDMYLAFNGLLVSGEDIYFAGYSTGFQTQRASFYSSEEPGTNSYVYKDNSFQANDCLITKAQDFSPTSIVTRYSGDEVLQGLTQRQDSSIDLFSRQPFSLNLSRSEYVGSFKLLNPGLKRPCAFKSQDLTPAQYYRGQNAMEYDLRSQTGEMGITFLDYPYATFINGTSSSSLAIINRETQTIFIQSDEETAVGQHIIQIRECDNLDRLTELMLPVEVLPNTYPDFVEELETAFTLDGKEAYRYQLPDLVDPEGNDESEVYLSQMEGQEDRYPEFISINEENVITFAAESWAQYRGKTFYFILVVKEKNSESVKYPYYCTVRVLEEDPLTIDVEDRGGDGEGEDPETIDTEDIDGVDEGEDPETIDIEDPDDPLNIEIKNNNVSISIQLFDGASALTSFWQIAASAAALYMAF